MRTNRFFAALALSACLSLALGCTPPISSKSPSTSAPSTTATASLKVMIRTEQAYENFTWSINEMMATLTELALLEGGTEIGKASFNTPRTDIAYRKSFRSVDVPSGTYDGLKLFLSLDSATVYENIATRSEAVVVDNPLSFAKALNVPANKRTVLIVKPDLRKMGTPGSFKLTPESVTLDTRLQELVSPDGYPMGYFNHFDKFSFEQPDIPPEYEDMDLDAGPYGSEGQLVFRSVANGSGETKQFVDLGEKSLKSVTAAPADEELLEKVGLTAGHCYVVKTNRGKYAKFRVVALAGDEHMLDDVNAIAIEYHYQSDGAKTFTK